MRKININSEIYEQLQALARDNGVRPKDLANAVLSSFLSRQDLVNTILEKINSK